MKVTVEEFIKKLQEYPKDYEVKVLNQSGYYYLPPEVEVIGETVCLSTER